MTAHFAAFEQPGLVISELKKFIEGSSSNHVTRTPSPQRGIESKLFSDDEEVDPYYSEISAAPSPFFRPGSANITHLIDTIEQTSNNILPIALSISRSESSLDHIAEISSENSTEPVASAPTSLSVEPIIEITPPTPTTETSVTEAPIEKDASKDVEVLSPNEESFPSKDTETPYKEASVIDTPSKVIETSSFASTSTPVSNGLINNKKKNKKRNG
jgi:hypothetical protein